MARLGPFEPRPRLAVAVSGGPDSMALCLLACAWAAGQGGSVLALIVDHGLRADSAAEAELTRARLAKAGIAARVLAVAGLARGPALAARAREARYAVLEAACADADILHLLLGHQAADQAETVLMRALGGSGPHGLAAMAALVEHPRVGLLRPLLDLPPGRLRATLRAAGWEWAEDPSNADPRATRGRLRAMRRDRAGEGPATRALAEAARADGRRRAADEALLADELAECATIRPEGFAVISGRLSAAALVRVVAIVAGRGRPVPHRRAAMLAEDLRPATLGGARLLPAGRLGQGWLVVREAAAMERPVPARFGAVWDRRFRFAGAKPSPLPSPKRGGGTLSGKSALGEGGWREGLTVGALGDGARMFRRVLPAIVLRTLPAVRSDERLVAVPHLGWPDQTTAAAFRCLFASPLPLAPAPFIAG